MAKGRFRTARLHSARAFLGVFVERAWVPLLNPEPVGGTPKASHISGHLLGSLSLSAGPCHSPCVQEKAVLLVLVLYNRNMVLLGEAPDPSNHLRMHDSDHPQTCLFDSQALHIKAIGVP